MLLLLCSFFFLSHGNVIRVHGLFKFDPGLLWSVIWGFSVAYFIRSYWGLSGGFSLASGVTEVCHQGVSLWHFIRSYWGLSSGGFSVAFHQELLKHFIRGYCVVFYQGISMCFFIMGYRGLSSGVTVVFHPGLLFSLSSGVTIQSLIRGYCSFSSWVTLLSSGVTLRSVIRNYTVFFFFFIRGYCGLSPGVTLQSFIRGYCGLSPGVILQVSKTPTYLLSSGVQLYSAVTLYADSTILSLFTPRPGVRALHCFLF